MIFDSTALADALNTAMAPDFGDVFRVVYINPLGDAETRVEGKRQITENKVTLWLPPAESALAWAAQNPQ